MTPSPEMLMALFAALDLDSGKKPQEEHKEPPSCVPRYASETDALIFAAKLAKATPGDVIIIADPTEGLDRTGVLCGMGNEGEVRALIFHKGRIAMLNSSAALVREVIPLQDYLASKHNNA